MFRKPRDDNSKDPLAAVIPSVGRPPTPPLTTASKKSKPPTLTSNSSSVHLFQSMQPQGRTTSTPIKSKGKGNQSILSFFKKDGLPQKASTVSVECKEDALFFGSEETTGQKQEDKPRDTSEPSQIPTPPSDHSRHWVDAPSEPVDDATRYNEIITPLKKRRTGATPMGFLRPKHGVVEEVAETSIVSTTEPVEEIRNQLDDEAKPVLRRELTSATTAEFFQYIGFDKDKNGLLVPVKEASEDDLIVERSRSTTCQPQDPPATTGNPISEPPPLKREPTSYIDLDGFEGLDDFIDDEFPEEGEEYQERQWMDEQFLKEQDMESDQDVDRNEPNNPKDANASEPCCPVCQASLVGVEDTDVALHVNNCLDGRPTPLRSATKKEPRSPPVEPERQAPPHKRFQRSAVARPGQENPFSLAISTTTGSSAFSKIMSSHAEDAAWATAAAAEMASRGKAAYQRTCPFYKILPGLFICVDAFRYGAVQGCEAYFLSHFHSDHYIGLTSSWCHGPIYCSHVTANLVRRQLRVDPKWVVDLEFEQTVEVPNTQGVQVTMIPANHCPGSSLYLFEKVIGKGKTPKVQRVLHCGDFRACPAHVQHPLLRPDVVDVITGKNVRQQRLDVCYLDTTYLTPKYAFPSQEEVIKACADMCVSLSKERIDESDDWETTKKQRAGSGMVKFVRKDNGLIKEENNDDGEVDAMTLSNQHSGKRTRGRLLVICGTYSIGKERICLGIARALNCKIYAPPNKQKICAALEDSELSARLTSDPLEAQVHMQMIMEIRAETLADYLTQYRPHFSRIVGFRPSGWNYRPPNSRFTESPLVTTVLHSDNWKSRYSMSELVPQRGSTREASCFGVPYSEHSSFRELTMFCCALRIDKIIPTVNVGSAKSREKMKMWCEKWATHKKKSGLFKVEDGQVAW